MTELIEKMDRLEKLILSTQKNVLTIDEVCVLTGLSKSHLYKLTMKQQIPHYKQAKHLYFEREEVESWLKKHPVLTMDQVVDKASDYLKMKRRAN